MTANFLILLYRVTWKATHFSNTGACTYDPWPSVVRTSLRHCTYLNAKLNTLIFSALIKWSNDMFLHDLPKNWPTSWLHILIISSLISTIQTFTVISDLRWWLPGLPKMGDRPSYIGSIHIQLPRKINIKQSKHKSWDCHKARDTLLRVVSFIYVKFK